MTRSTLATAALVALLSLGACDPYPQVKRDDTIEAYETYLKEHPNSRNVMKANTRLQQLYWEKAEAAKTLEAYDEYMERFPDGIFREKAYKNREKHLWEWAEAENTVESWQKYIDTYPSFDTKKAKKAKSAREVMEHAPNLPMGKLEMAKANLAEDPEGPLNGYMFSVDVTNNTDKTIVYLGMRIRFYDADGKRVGSEKWAVVSSNFGIPVEEEKKIPIKPGETRKWELLTDVPDGFAEKADLAYTGIKFEEYRPN